MKLINPFRDEYKEYQNNIKTNKPFGKSELNLSKNKEIFNKENDQGIDDEFWYLNKSKYLLLFYLGDSSKKTSKYNYKIK